MLKNHILFNLFNGIILSFKYEFVPKHKNFII